MPGRPAGSGAVGAVTAVGVPTSTTIRAVRFRNRGGTPRFPRPGDNPLRDAIAHADKAGSRFFEEPNPADITAA